MQHNTKLKTGFRNQPSLWRTHLKMFIASIVFMASLLNGTFALAQTNEFDSTLYYTIRNNAVGSDSVLTCYSQGSGPEGSTNLRFQKLGSNASQFFQIKKYGSGYYIQTYYPNMSNLGCLGPWYDLYRIGGCPDNGNCTWLFNKQSDGTYTITTNTKKIQFYLTSDLSATSSKKPSPTKNKNCFWTITAAPPVLPLIASTYICEPPTSSSVTVMGAIQNYNDKSLKISSAFIIYGEKESGSLTTKPIKDTNTTFSDAITGLESGTEYSFTAGFELEDAAGKKTKLYDNSLASTTATTLSTTRGGTSASAPCAWGYANEAFWPLEEVGGSHNQCAAIYQSPIGIYDTEVKLKSDLPKIQLNYHNFVVGLLENSHHTIQITDVDSTHMTKQQRSKRNMNPNSETRGNPDTTNSLTYGDKNYYFLQAHIHTPSEHTINGKAADMEIHIVHQDMSGKLLVLAVLFNENNTITTAAGKVLDSIYTKWPKTVGQSEITNLHINLDQLFDKNNLDYYTYGDKGSLTTPTCDQGVTFLILKDASKIPGPLLAKYKAKFGNNARPVHPLNGRTVNKSK